MKRIAVVCLLLVLAVALSGCGRLRERRNAASPVPTTQSQRATSTPEPPRRSDVDAAPAPGQTTAAGQPQAEPQTAATSAGCGIAHAAGTSVETTTSGGVQRSYRLHVPVGYDPDRPAPLVLNFHGFRSNAEDQERYSGMTAAADAHGFVTVAPDGTNDPQRWYIYGRRERGYVDDYAFTRELIDKLSAELCIDPARVYATGISNGAAMSSLSACQLNDLFAAVAPVAGSPYSQALCRGKAPVPVIAFHGTEDKLVPFDGGNGGRLGLPVTPVRENMLAWAQHNGCDLSLETQRIAPDVVLESYGGCEDNADVQLYVIEGGGHTWPGARNVPWLGQTTQSIDATALIWDFFAGHAKQ